MPLPILVAPEFAFYPQLTLKRDHSWQHQSLWSRLLKLAAWNELNGDELAYILGPTISRPDGLFRKLRGADWRRLRHFLKDTNHHLYQAFPPDFRLPGYLPTAILRGCPHCYSFGFHSALFQLAVLDRCPLHHGQLLEGCPICSFPIPYCIPTLLKRTGFKCPHCHTAFLQFHAIHAAPELPFHKLSFWRHWLLKAMSRRDYNDPNTTPYRALAWLESCRQWNRHYSEMPSYRRITGSPNPMPLDLAETFKIGEVAARAYYQVRRIKRRQLGPEYRNRYDQLSHQTVLMPSDSNDFPIICFLLWRLAWEHSFALDNAGINLQQHAFPISVANWLSSCPLVGDKVRLNRIHQEIWQSYQRSEWLTQWMYNRGGVLLTLSAMKLITQAFCIRQFR